MYAETSGGGGSANFMLSKTFPAGTELYGISFQYHKYGDTIGSATLESSADGLDWQTLWTKSGNMGDQWLQATAYADSGQQILRWRYAAGGGYTGDFALDDIKIGDCLLIGCSAAPNNPCMVPSGSCDQATGLCQVLPDGTTCDDGDSATLGGMCSAGVCMGTTAAPTPEPTATPSFAPTRTFAPTPAPTLSPAPTATPTVVPTPTPTVVPTSAPTIFNCNTMPDGTACDDGDDQTTNDVCNSGTCRGPICIQNYYMDRISICEESDAGIHVCRDEWTCQTQTPTPQVNVRKQSVTHHLRAYLKKLIQK